MKEYYIIGSSGFAKEVYFLAENTLDKEIQFSGFIDFRPKEKEIVVRGRKERVIDENYFLSNIKPNENISLFMGIGDPKLINKLSITFKAYKFPNLINKKFVMDHSISMGSGNIITFGCVFTVDITIGSFNIFNLNSTIGHDTEIGSSNVFNPGTNISGGVIIGDTNLLGTNSTVLQYKNIGNNNTVGASCLINKDFDSGNLIVGIPGKVLKR
ncbi:acetyltransferase [Marivirga salinae]|uniref:Acetyltransferase n=1 Tax=Marivirga salinarum TaxID=3059078 RepID=A0AA49GB66_9BACT|nr:acetyltransferase [Marivirga sp. BDSF4-3]WKK78569.2 acetyltransferase [Marivirga sp. BDSF4-3]